MPDDQHPVFVAWIDGLEASTREEWNSQIAQGYLLETSQPSHKTIRIAAVEQSDWKARPAVSTLDDALKYFMEPFCILLENSMNDRNFLLRLAGDRDRRILLELEKEKIITFENGGGISFMPAIVKKVSGEPWKIDRFWVLFDGDGLDPDRPSSQSEYLAKECRAAGIEHHQLKRRNIENYLTKDALSGWVFNRPAMRRSRRPIFEAYCKLDDAQREHYYLKTGFRKEHSTVLYASLPTDIEAALHGGFGSTISHLFDGDAVSESALRREGMLTEMQPVVAKLLAMIR